MFRSRFRLFCVSVLLFAQTVASLQGQISGFSDALSRSSGSALGTAIAEQSRAGQSYRSTFGARLGGSSGFTRARGSGKAGGIIVGRPPLKRSDQAALSIPRFEYRIREEQGATRVRIELFDAAGRPFAFEIDALTALAASNIAVSQDCVLYTLTGNSEADFDGPDAVLDSTLVHPALHNRLGQRAAVLDLFADYRASDALSAEAELADMNLQTLAAMARLQAAIEREEEDLAQYRLDLMSSLFRRARFVETNDISDAWRSWNEPTYRKLVGADVVSELQRAERAAESPLAAMEELHWTAMWAEVAPADAIPDIWDRGPYCLSAVVERSWRLAPESFVPPSVATNPHGSVVAFERRVVLERAEELDDDLDLEWLTLANHSRRTTYETLEKLSPAERQLLQEWNDFVCVNRLIRSVVNEDVVDFPTDRWLALVDELAALDVGRKNALDSETIAETLRTFSVEWHDNAMFGDETEQPAIDEDVALR